MADRWQTKWFEEVDSTNTRMSEEKLTLSDCAVYAALFQTAGKGQRGNKWESGRGCNLTFSILFKPENISAHDQFIVSEVATLGIADYLQEKGIKASIKWPNDIYVGDRKICGILIENTIRGDKLSHSIVGIGVNLNQKLFRSDAPNPISVTLLTGEEYDVKVELEKLLSHIVGLYDRLHADGASARQAAAIEETYTSKLYRRGEWHIYEDVAAGERLEGKILGVDRNACLRVEKRDGSISAFAFKEIKYILPELKS